jgi:hypothetical protein
VEVNPDFKGYGQDRIAALYRQLRERLKQIPGVRSASLSLYAPMSGNNWGNSIAFEGRAFAHRQQDRESSSWVRLPTLLYFETMGQRLLRGRLIDEHDTPAFRHVPVVNETFAQKYFKNESPLGRHFGLGSAKHSLDYEMAGVVKDAKWRDPYEPPGPMFFLPLMQESAEQWQESPGFELYQLHRTARRREPGKPRTYGAEGHRGD